MMRNIRPDITARFFKFNPLSAKPFERKTNYLEAQIRWLTRDCSIESFNMAFLLLAEAELNHDIEAGREIANLTMMYYPMIEDGYDMSFFDDSLLERIRHRFYYHWLFDEPEKDTNFHYLLRKKGMDEFSENGYFGISPKKSYFDR